MMGIRYWYMGVMPSMMFGDAPQVLPDDPSVRQGCGPRIQILVEVRHDRVGINPAQDDVLPVVSVGLSVDPVDHDTMAKRLIGVYVVVDLLPIGHSKSGMIFS